MRQGWDPRYKIWVEHGEPTPPTPPPVIDNTRQPPMSDMTALLNDLSYIPPNNEHNEPTQGDIGETSNEPTQATRNEFEELYMQCQRGRRNPCFSKNVISPSVMDSMLPTVHNMHKEDILKRSCVCNRSRWKRQNTPGQESFLRRCCATFRSFLDYNVCTSPSHTARIWDLACYGKCTEHFDSNATRVKGKHPSHGGVKIKRNVHVELNWTKRSIFYELEYWSFLSLRHNLDIMHIEKNVLEAILNTLLMNDKSKDTAKARQDLQMLGIRSGLWLGQTKNGKCLKPQAAYSFTPENRKKFCQYIKGVKLPDGFGSCFKHKVTDNDTNITGMKSHDSQIKVVDILCELELIYPPAFFDIMVHLVIHLPIEALEGGPIRPRWMYPFERYMKKLKGYVRNKAKPEDIDDIIGDEDALPHDLADSDAEDLINVDDDGVEKVYSSEEED
ncbi:hypothetical protein Tco_0725673 [Tanacetum coccineum]|uniref:DUF4218 domain-containing protein n=1 Tax=Tanacetum coccineum TaxID=301880 RepID=A0ABQ4YG13_9ASTR